ncbi:MAG: hypothetical protein NC133_04570 [Prevotella sp.]|nr:hypothetical protein [Prevotella sp.]
MNQETVENFTPCYCVVPVKLLFDKSKTTQEKIDTIMQMLEVQTKEAQKIITQGIDQINGGEQ